MSQLVFSIFKHPKKVDSHASEGMTLPMTANKEQKHPISMSFI